MQVVESQGSSALCESRGELRRIDTLLVGDQPVGTWLLTFLDTAREVLTSESAAQIADALQAVTMAMQGENGIDHLFRDLIDHEPELPDFLHDFSSEPTPGD